MTNFDYLKSEKEFESFVNIAITAEKVFNIDIGTCVFNCRRALEMAIKWMYSVDNDLEVPYQDSLYSFIPFTSAIRKAMLAYERLVFSTSQIPL